MSLYNKNKGSVSFVFYFVIGLALLAVAGYYVGINEQKNLFGNIVAKKQQQDTVINGVANQPSDVTPPPEEVESPIKSLIDSPSVVLKNLSLSKEKNQSIGTTSGSGVSAVSFGDNIDQNSPSVVALLNFVNQAGYFIKTSLDKTGKNITLIAGEVRGNNCYNTAVERLCFPKYKLRKIWAVGDLNADGLDDSIISISATESILGKENSIDNFYSIISASSSYVIVPFNFGVYSPVISSAEITGGNAVLVGSFYASGDAIGAPSAKKVIRYSFEKTDNASDPDVLPNPSAETYSIKKIGEAKLFKEQGENTSLWYPYNYTQDSLSFSFKIPDSWQKEETFGKDIKIVLTETGGRKLILDTKSIVSTCSEYTFNLGDASNVKVKSSEFIDLGEFGVGSYVKFSVNVNDQNQYRADICVTDKNNDKKVFSLYSTTNEDSIPYFAIFDKIWSTFKIKQE